MSIAFNPNVVGTASGMFDFVNPDPACVADLPEIAITMARLARFGGRGERFLSVAEHTVRCVRVAKSLNMDLTQCRAVFMHDVPEFYLGDIPTPLKRVLSYYADLEEGVSEACHVAYGVEYSHEAVAICDRYAFVAEWEIVFPGTPAPLPPSGEPPTSLKQVLRADCYMRRDEPDRSSVVARFMETAWALGIEKVPAP